ncbi:FAD-binding oxidoreductase [Cyanobacterium stanieri LEGE 03274]|uniref:FAD-binding oxidoreductase n=1 Tax=Cyanobacterium stanieri LEGE 03274 TaxID=1828756 RepID=A0ABR9V741_9CHRO|nr:FAD-binding oxidoreductase [Cyanobacterium stanieri]MBE9223321.1 FAD-binding oxidoreductase [Cyanobacterium stanieri LEGE 03274]
MNQFFQASSPRQIKEILDFCNVNSIEIIEWKQNSRWQNKIKMAGLADCIPRYLVFPNTTVMLSQLVNFAYRNHCRVIPTGEGTKLSWGGLSQPADLLISMVNFNGVVEYGEKDLVITVQGGMKIKDLNHFLASRGQFVPIDPFFEDDATVGGVVATGNSLCWRQRYGGVRDLILGLSFVRADGEAVKAGGKVVKNVAGYDLMKLFTGSYGSLGIITEVTFRVYPLMASSSSVFITGEKKVLGVLRNMITQSSLTPTMADFVAHYSAIGALGSGADFGLGIRFEGIKPSVEQQVKQVESWAEDLGLSSLVFGDALERNFWKDIKVMDYPTICKVGLMGNRIINLFSRFGYEGFINISSGVGFVFLGEDIRAHQVLALRRFCEDNGGYLSMVRSPLALQKQVEPWGYVGNGLEMMKKIKEKFDPQGVFYNRLF